MLLFHCTGVNREMSTSSPLFVYIDESGDFNFSPKGSNFYTLTAVFTHHPEECANEIITLRHQILAGEILSHLNDEYLESKLCHHFHASEDRQQVRDRFFDIIQNMKCFKVHSIVVRKNRTNPSLREPTRFYPKMMGYLLHYILKSYSYSMLCVFVDGIPTNKTQKSFIRAVKKEIKSKNPNKPYKIYHPDSASNNFLQISDYVNWAIHRKWERGDLRSYNLINKFIGRPELDIFRYGDVDYY
jgi:hypothetical protein